ncbi:MAG: CRISPR-associated helicase Cas3' [Candidatus Bathyarchaeia archaeon]
MIREADRNRILVVEAPTGYGKSIISQAVALQSLEEGLKCIIAFPLRSLLEDQLSKFKAMLSKLNHDERSIGVRYMHHPESKYLLRPISLTTIDTLSLTLFGIAPEDLEIALRYYDGTSTWSMGHYLFSRSMVLLSDIILDEVHLLSDMTKSLNFLMALIWIMAGHGGRTILMSATIPKVLEELLRREAGGVGLNFVKFSENPDEAFLRERMKKKYEVNLEKLGNDKFEKILGWLKEGLKEGFKRSIVIFNTIHEAIEFYKTAKEKLDFPRDRVLLLHSRFTKGDREIKEKMLEGLKGSDEYVIVATQVIEAGVDISSNLFISDLAPASSLIQRLGRFLRYDGEVEGRVHLWYENDKGERYKGVYDKELFNKTLEFLESNSGIRFHDPESYRSMLNIVYDESSFSLNMDEIMKLISISSTLRNPNQAIENFLSLEGSFVREDALVPVIPRSLWNEGMPISQLESRLVPIGLSTLFNLKPTEKIIMSVDEPVKASKRPLSEKFWNMDRRKVLRCALSSGFIAFVIDGDYNEDLGLVTKNGKSSKLFQERRTPHD